MLRSNRRHPADAGPGEPSQRGTSRPSGALAGRVESSRDSYRGLARLRGTLELVRVAEDPLYFAETYVDSDSVLPADAPFAVEACRELAAEYRQPGQN